MEEDPRTITQKMARGFERLPLHKREVLIEMINDKFDMWNLS